MDRCETPEETAAQAAGQQSGETGTGDQQVTETSRGDSHQLQQAPSVVPGVPDVPLEGITVIPAGTQGGCLFCPFRVFYSDYFINVSLYTFCFVCLLWVHPSVT